MFNSFGASIWMMPFSKHCRSENAYVKHFSTGRKKGHSPYLCDDHEFQSNYSGWPTNIINIEIPSVRGTMYNFSRIAGFCSCVLIQVFVADMLTCFPLWQEMKLILHSWEHHRSMCLTWNVVSQLNCPFLPVSFLMEPFSRLLLIMILTARDFFINWNGILSILQILCYSALPLWYASFASKWFLLS